MTAKHTRARRFLVAACVVIASVGPAAASGAAAQEPPGSVTDNETITVIDGDRDSGRGAGNEGRGGAGGGHGHGCVDQDVPGRAVGHERKCSPRPTSGGVARGDFNGDGKADLSIGVPLEDVGSLTDAGAVHVIYGSDTGLTGANQLWHEDVGGVPGVAEADDQFGGALAAGNFNGDAYSDLAIGRPYEDVGNLTDAGAVVVLLGSAGGLTASGAHEVIQGTNGIQGTVEADDRFGATLVWGHFNAGSFGDLAVSAPGEDIGAVADAGAVNVVYGSSVGLTATGGPNNQLWHQDVSGIHGAAEEGDEFAASSAAGDFDGNGYSDLAIGVPNEGLVHAPTGESFPHAGAVHVLYGGSNGLTAGGTDFLHDTVQVHSWFDEPDGVHGTVFEIGIQAHAHFGLSLAAGDMEHEPHPFHPPGPDGRADLGVGVPYGDLGVCPEHDECTLYEDKGWVYVFHGSAGGVANAALIAEDPVLMKDDGGLFGWSIVIANFDGSGGKELVAGMPGFDDYFSADIGSTTPPLGLPSANSFDTAWEQRTRAVCIDRECFPGDYNLVADDDDQLGASLAAWDIDGDGKADLAAGVPGDDFVVGGQLIHDAGVVHVLYGNGRQEHLYQGGPIGTTGGLLQGTAESGDEFGSALY